MKNKLHFIFLLLFILGCKNTIKPSDYTKEAIDKKYPYWQVGIDRFYIAPEISSYTVITVEEKKMGFAFFGFDASDNKHSRI